MSNSAELERTFVMPEEFDATLASEKIFDEEHFQVMLAVGAIAGAHSGASREGGLLSAEEVSTARIEWLTSRAEWAERRVDTAGKDMLTGLPLRGQFSEIVAPHLRRRYNDWRRNENTLTDGKQMWLFMFDVKGLKSVNDNIGHDAGDEVLRRYANAVQSKTRPGQMLSRFGGDEIAVFDPAIEETAVEEVLRRIIRACANSGTDELIEVRGVAVQFSQEIVIQAQKLAGERADIPAGNLMEAFFNKAGATLTKSKKRGVNLIATNGHEPLEL